MFDKKITLIAGPLMSGKTIVATNFANSYKRGNILYYANDSTAHSVRKRLHALNKDTSIVDLHDIKLSLEPAKNISVVEKEFNLLDIEFAIMGEEIDYVIIDTINFLNSEQNGFIPKVISLIAQFQQMSNEYHTRFILCLNLISTQEFKSSDLSEIFPDIDIVTLVHKTSELELTNQTGLIKTLKVNRRSLKTEKAKALEFD